MSVGVAALMLVASLAQRGAAPAPSPEQLLAEQIRVREEASDAPLRARAALLGFYARRSFRPAWSNEHGPNRLADDLVAALGRADLEGLNPEDYHFNEDVEQAVRRFQWRHGLEEAGVVDAVNIAAYELQVIDDDEVGLAMRVVVGKAYRRTPVFSDTVRYIVLNPNWHVPRSIAVDELIPKVQSDPSYLERFGMRLLTSGPDPQEVDPSTVDWSTITAENFPYRFRQDPGSLNALGHIKFMFPNPYDVYLHDPPSRRLFAETQRDFSHGCIRVEKPIDLAVYLMKKGSRWDREAIELALDEGTERTIYLPRPMPIHLQYWTAWADEDGTIQFRSDIHGLDQPLTNALQAPLAINK